MVISTQGNVSGSVPNTLRAKPEQTLQASRPATRAVSAALDFCAGVAAAVSGISVPGGYFPPFMSFSNRLSPKAGTDTLSVSSQESTREDADAVLSTAAASLATDLEYGSATERHHENIDPIRPVTRDSGAFVENYPSGTREVAIAFEGVTLSASTQAAGTTRPILRNICFEVRDGETVFIIGPSGAGKSRLLRLVNRLEEPSGGQVRLWGTPVPAYPPGELRGKLVGFLSQQPALPCLAHRRPGLLEALRRLVTRETLWELILGKRRQRSSANTEEPAKSALETLVRLGVVSRTELEQRLPEALHIAGLSRTILDRPLAALSGGERARLGLTRVLLQQPRILLLDEVTSSLDAATAAQVLQRLSDWKERIRATILIVTHRLSEVTDGQLILVRDGELFLRGDARALLGTADTAASIHRLLTGESLGATK
jgi:ABC-type methionine transport system ATPase subunit